MPATFTRVSGPIWLQWAEGQILLCKELGMACIYCQRCRFGLPITIAREHFEELHDVYESVEDWNRLRSLVDNKPGCRWAKLYDMPLLRAQAGRGASRRNYPEQVLSKATHNITRINPNFYRSIQVANQETAKLPVDILRGDTETGTRLEQAVKRPEAGYPNTIIPTTQREDTCKTEVQDEAISKEKSKPVDWVAIRRTYALIKEQSRNAHGKDALYTQREDTQAGKTEIQDDAITKEKSKPVDWVAIRRTYALIKEQSRNAKSILSAELPRQAVQSGTVVDPGLAVANSLQEPKKADWKAIRRTYALVRAQRMADTMSSSNSGSTRDALPLISKADTAVYNDDQLE